MTVTFSSNRRVEEPLEYVLDFGTYLGLREVEILGLHDAAEALKAIETALRQSNRY